MLNLTPSWRPVIPLWTQLSDLLNEEKINDAYDTIYTWMNIEGQDDATLIKLMSQTGVCFDQLSKENLNKILSSISSFFSSKLYIDACLPWV